MGFKRPLDEEEFQEFPLKHPKQVDCGNKLTSFAEIYPCCDLTKKGDIVGDAFKHDFKTVVSELSDKQFEISAPFTWVTGSSSKVDAGFGSVVCPSISSEFFELYFSRRSVLQLEDTYSSLLDGLPRKQVPIGPNHQAEVPVWDAKVLGKRSSVSDGVVNAREGELMGHIVMMMPDAELSAASSVMVGDGREDCLCPDQGSVRCVRHHVKEAREKIRETLGYEKFVQLGFCEMGEEVSQRWTEEEERVFQKVVYSNRVSHDKNFWEHLSMVFPSRSKKEIVSYYFNVFILQRRAIQNRSTFLDSDSDGEEWQGDYGNPLGVAVEDADHTIESLVGQDVRVGLVHSEDDLLDDNEDEDDSDEDEDDDGYSDVDAGNAGNMTEYDVVRSLLSKSQVVVSPEDCRSESEVRHVGKNLGGDEKNFVAQNASLVASGCHPNKLDYSGSADTRACLQENGVKSDHKEGLHCLTDGFCPGFLLEPCGAKVWDARYPMSPLKSIDLVPTRNMIEEIFGPCTQNGKSE